MHSLVQSVPFNTGGIECIDEYFLFKHFIKIVKPIFSNKIILFHLTIKKFWHYLFKLKLEEIVYKLFHFITIPVWYIHTQNRVPMKIVPVYIAKNDVAPYGYVILIRELINQQKNCVTYFSIILCREKVVSYLRKIQFPICKGKKISFLSKKKKNLKWRNFYSKFHATYHREFPDESKFFIQRSLVGLDWKVNI